MVNHFLKSHKIQRYGQLMARQHILWSPLQQKGCLQGGQQSIQIIDIVTEFLAFATKLIDIIIIIIY